MFLDIQIQISKFDFKKIWIPTWKENKQKHIGK